MDKINNINFTGISNIGVIQFQRTKNSVSKSLSMVLKDDFKGTDMKDFKSVVNKITKYPSYYNNGTDPNVLNIECLREHRGDTLYINGHEVAVCDKNLPMFSYIAKLTRRIAGMPEQEMIVNNDYKQFAAADSLVCGGKLRVAKDVPEASAFDQFFNKSAVKRGAKDVNNFIQNMMEKFFA